MTSFSFVTCTLLYAGSTKKLQKNIVFFIFFKKKRVEPLAPQPDPTLTKATKTKNDLKTKEKFIYYQYKI